MSRAETDQDIASTLLETFFPSVSATVPIALVDYSQLPWVAIMEEEVKSALNSALQLKAPGSDGLPTRMWKELWPVVKGLVLTLFQTSLITGKVPDQ